MSEWRVNVPRPHVFLLTLGAGRRRGDVRVAGKSPLVHFTHIRIRDFGTRRTRAARRRTEQTVSPPTSEPL